MPRRAEIRHVLESLASGRTTPGEASAWADGWVSANGVPEGDDEAGWQAMTRLAGADLECAPGEPLHTYLDWLAAFDAA